MRRIRSHLTYANVMVTLLAFVVLAGGAAYAANTIGSADIIDGQVKTPDLANNAVKTGKVLDESLTGDGVQDNAIGGADVNEALVERGFAIVSGGTDTHLMLVDLRPKKMTGKDAEKLLDRAGITVNKNTIPDDPQSPFVTSGIRLGTPALTTRGMGTAEMRRVAELIDRVLISPDDVTIARVKREVGELTHAFPLYTTRRA